MADYSRRNRGSLNNNRNNDPVDDFDWESFDRETSEQMNTRTENLNVSGRRRQADNRRRRARDNASRSRSDMRRTMDTDSRHPRKKKRKKQLTEKQLRFRHRLRLVTLVACLICIVIFAGMFVGMYAAVSKELDGLNIDNLALNKNSTIYYYDHYGQPQELSKINSDSSRIWVDSSAISQNFKDAIVAIEDERFNEHRGVDLKRTFGATLKYIGSKIGLGQSNYGGSTITQQVIKNITQEDDFKATRKIKEIMRAIALERKLDDKDKILTMYCNIVYFANNCYGVEAASRTYFNKPAAELTLAEAASIAGITQYPSEYDPIAHPEKNTEKRNTVLMKMRELGYIDDAEYNQAVSTTLVTTDEYRREQSQMTSWFEDQVVADVINALMKERNYSQEFATSQVYNGGLQIYSTIDRDIQDIMENVFENTDNFPYGTTAEAAMMVIDPYTGQIKGIIGGLGKKTDIRGWNRATQAIRQPGSAIKPLSVYAPAINLGNITEMTIINDEEIEVPDENGGWKPKNSYYGFKGEMTVKEAVARSANIPAVKVLDKVDVQNSFAYLQHNFRLSTLTEDDKNFASLALGGLTQGATVKDMAAAYGVFVNSGKYIAPYTFTEVRNPSGEQILVNNINETRAITDAAAYITADLLSGPVNLPYGTATRAQLYCDMPAYGKTGTTDKDFDKWFVGFTPYYVGACWFGFDSPSSLSESGIRGNPCVTAWKLVFDEISKNQERRELAIPTTVRQAEVCSISGQLASYNCESVAAYYVAGTEPKEYCEDHWNVHESNEFKTNSVTSVDTQNNNQTNTEAQTSATTAPVTQHQSGTAGGTGSNAGSGTNTGGSAERPKDEGGSSNPSGGGNTGGGLGGDTGTGGSGTGSSGTGSTEHGNPGTDVGHTGGGSDTGATNPGTGGGESANTKTNGVNYIEAE